MKNKKTIRRHLVVLYILFFSVVIISITAKIIPDAQRGARAAEKLNDTFAGSKSNDNSSFYFLNSVELEPYHSTGKELEDLATETRSITCYTDRVNVIVKETPVDGEGKPKDSLSVLGNRSIYTIASFVIALGYIVMIVLIALIIRSLHRSIKLEKPVQRSNAYLVRAIGLIIVLGELFTAMIQCQMNKDAAELIKVESCVINTHFSPDYIVIIIGILVLFMGELFSITHDITEEQKFTI